MVILKYFYQINSFHITDHFQYPLLWFSNVFMGYRKKQVVSNGLKKHHLLEITYEPIYKQCSHYLETNLLIWSPKGKGRSRRVLVIAANLKLNL